MSRSGSSSPPAAAALRARAKDRKERERKELERASEGTVQGLVDDLLALEEERRRACEMLEEGEVEQTR